MNKKQEYQLDKLVGHPGPDKYFLIRSKEDYSLLVSIFYSEILKARALSYILYITMILLSGFLIKYYNDQQPNNYTIPTLVFCFWIILLFIVINNQNNTLRIFNKYLNDTLVITCSSIEDYERNKKANEDSKDNGDSNKSSQN